MKCQSVSARKSSSINGRFYGIAAIKIITANALLGIILGGVHITSSIWIFLLTKTMPLKYFAKGHAKQTVTDIIFGTRIILFSAILCSGV